MSTKKYCLVPETSKSISVYNANTIIDLQQLPNINPNVKFRYCIDQFDKIKLFYIGDKSQNSEDTEISYFNYKIIQSIKAIFNISELNEYKIILDDNSDARVEFSIWYDTDGNHIEKAKLVEKNKYNTILLHQYTYNFYKLFNA